MNCYIKTNIPVIVSRMSIVWLEFSKLWNNILDNLQYLKKREKQSTATATAAAASTTTTPIAIITTLIAAKNLFCSGSAQGG